MTDLGSISPQPIWKGRIQKGSTNWKGHNALIFHTKYGIESDGYFGRRGCFGAYCQNRGDAPWAPLPGANGYTEHNLTSRHAPEAPILSQGAFGPPSFWQNFFEENAGFGGVDISPSRFEGGSRNGAQHDKAWLSWYHVLNLIWIGQLFRENKTFWWPMPK